MAGPTNKTDPTEAPALEASAPGEAIGGLDLIQDVELRLTVEIGGSKLLLRDVLQLGKGAIVELDRDSGELADILVNGRLIARGEVTSVDDRMVVRVVDVLADPARERDT